MSEICKASAELRVSGPIARLNAHSVVKMRAPTSAARSALKEGNCGTSKQGMYTPFTFLLQRVRPCFFGAGARGYFAPEMGISAGSNAGRGYDRSQGTYGKRSRLCMS